MTSADTEQVPVGIRAAQVDWLIRDLAPAVVSFAGLTQSATAMNRLPRITAATIGCPAALTAHMIAARAAANLVDEQHFRRLAALGGTGLLDLPAVAAHSVPAGLLPQARVAVWLAFPSPCAWWAYRCVAVSILTVLRAADDPDPDDPLIADRLRQRTGDAHRRLDAALTGASVDTRLPVSA